MKLNRFLIVFMSGILVVLMSGCDKSTNGANNGNKKTNVVSIKNGDVVTASNDSGEIEIHWEKTEFMDDVMTTSYVPVGGVYAHKKDIDGETYLCAMVKIKNTGGSSVDQYIISPKGNQYYYDIKVIFDDKYTYSMEQVDITEHMLGDRWKLDPLKTIDIWFCASVPDEIISSPYTITFDIGDATYKYTG